LGDQGLEKHSIPNGKRLFIMEFPTFVSTNMATSPVDFLSVSWDQLLQPNIASPGLRVNENLAWNMKSFFTGH
jgi:hypothetical protein